MKDLQTIYNRNVTNWKNYTPCYGTTPPCKGGGQVLQQYSKLGLVGQTRVNKSRKRPGQTEKMILYRGRKRVTGKIIQFKIYIVISSEKILNRHLNFNLHRIIFDADLRPKKPYTSFSMELSCFWIFEVKHLYYFLWRNTWLPLNINHYLQINNT